MIYTDAEYLRAYVREVVEPPGYTTTAKRLLAIADRLEKIDAEAKRRAQETKRMVADYDASREAYREMKP